MLGDALLCCYDIDEGSGFVYLVVKVHSPLKEFNCAKKKLFATGFCNLFCF